jgi:outer membrane protein
MKEKILLVLACSALLTAKAQQPASRWSMDDCMRYAVEHSTTVEKQQYNLDNAKAGMQAAVSAFLPSLQAGISGQYNWGRSIDPSTNTYNNVKTFNNYYELYASLNLFDGGQTYNQWKQAKVVRQQGLNNLQKAKDDKAILVMQDFVDVAYCQGCIRLAADKLGDSQQLLHKTQRQEDLGMKGRPDVTQIKAQVAQDDYNLTHQQNLYNTALLKLKADMNFPSADTLAVDTTYQSISPALALDNSDDILAYASANNPTAQAAALNVKNMQLEYHISQGKLLPTLSLSAGVSTDYYKNFSGGATLSFSNQFKNNRGEFVGATLSIPLFDHLTALTSKRKARNNLRIAVAEQQEVIRQLQSDVRQAVMDRDGYAKEIMQMSRKVDADSLAYYVTHRKFEVGTMNAIDLQTSANTLLQSRITLLQKRMLYVLKDRLVAYYKGNNLIIDK